MLTSIRTPTHLTSRLVLLLGFCHMLPSLYARQHHNVFTTNDGLILNAGVSFLERPSSAVRSNREQARILPRKISRVQENLEASCSQRRVRRITQLSRVAVARCRDTSNQANPAGHRRNQ